MTRSSDHALTSRRAVRLAAVPVALSLLAVAGCSGDKPEQVAAPTTTTTTSSTPTPTPSPTPTPPPATSPLTGLPQADAKVRGRSVIAIKIDNAPDARPQVGIDRADLVVEEPVEGGITRLMAVFQSQNPGEVGPVRSARLTDTSLVRAFGGGALVFSGASGATYRRIRNTPNVALREEGQGGGWRRDYSRQAPHNLFVNQSKMRSALGSKLNESPQRQFNFAAVAPVGGVPAKRGHLAWKSTTADWLWSVKYKRWLRSQDGTRDRLAGGKQLAFDNVVIMGVRTRTDPGLHDVNGALTPLPDLDDGGNVWLLRDGKVYRGAWDRGSVQKPLTFRGAGGKPLALKPGTTFIELLPQPATPKFR